MKITEKRFWVHLIIWMSYICYELAFVLITSSVRITIAPLLIFYSLNIGLFYFNAHILLDFTFFNARRRYFTSVCWMLVELTVYLIIKYFLDNILTGHFIFRRGHLMLTDIYLYENSYRGITYIGLSIGYFSTIYLFRFQKKNHEVETRELRTLARNLELENQIISVENAYLQNQISPHLLFNSLSFIYNAVYKISEEAGNAVNRLSQLMYYSFISADRNSTTSLAEEVKQLENLIALCGMLKHGDFGEKKYPARIDLRLEGDRFYFETNNKKLSRSLYPKGGLGLKNIDKRLYNHYKDQYSLVVNDIDGSFIVKLMIAL
jgi:sensor histidine kinase YesM